MEIGGGGVYPFSHYHNIYDKIKLRLCQFGGVKM
jgi:hypothetical protein